jgi:drug/metabolite transporter (DMT)-like permease
MSAGPSPVERHRRPSAAAPARRFAMPVPSREQVRAGIFYMVSAVFVFSLINAVVKWEAARYPVNEVVFFRCAFSLLPVLVLVAGGGGARLLRTRRFGEHLSRGALQFVSMIAVFAAFAMMPLANAVAITFSAPLFLTMLSIPMLGERVSGHRWAAVLAGFAGVLLMVGPGAGFGKGLASTGALLALASTAIGANVTIAVRRMTLTEASTTLVAYQTLIATGLSALLLPFAWVTPDWRDTLLMAGTGICAGIGQYWWTQAFRFAPAAVAAPFNYLAMIWSVVLGYLIWGDEPRWSLLGGVAVVVASGLYMLYRETRGPALQVVPLAIGSD